MYNLDNEQTSTIMDSLKASLVLDFDKAKTAQDMMLALRERWESLETAMRLRRADGFEKAKIALVEIAGAAIRGALYLSRKIRQAKENRDPELDLIKEEPLVRIVQPKVKNLVGKTVVKKVGKVRKILK